MLDVGFFAVVDCRRPRGKCQYKPQSIGSISSTKDHIGIDHSIFLSMESSIPFTPNNVRSTSWGWLFDVAVPGRTLGIRPTRGVA